MSFEDYAQRMFTKYRLALAIAVIKNKPENLSPEQYLSQLKEKIEHTESADPYIILTTDFNFDDNDDSLIGPEFSNNTNIEDLSLVNISCHDSKINYDNEIHDTTSIDLLQGFSTSIQEGTRNKDNVVTGGEYAIVNDVSTDGTNSLDEVLKMLRDIDENKDRPLHNSCLPTQENSQIVLSNSLNHHRQVSEENMAICDDFPSDKNYFIDLVSKTDTQIIVDEKIRMNVENNVNKRIKLSKADETQRNNLRKSDIIEDNVVVKSTYEMEVDMALNDIRENQYADSSTDFPKKSTAKVLKHITHELNQNPFEVNIEVINKTIDNKYVNENFNTAMTNTIETTTDDTILYTLHDFTQNTSHISQSQYQNMEIPQAFIHGNRHKNISKDNKVNEAAKNESRSINLGLGETPAILTVNSSDIRYIMDQSGKTYAVLQSIQLGKGIGNENITINNSKETHACKENSQEVNKEHNSTNIEETSQKNNTANTESIEIEDDLDKELTDPEVVPFKVVKELSKIKAYLNRKERNNSTDGCSSDSGYRSDSQNSFKSARLSDDWVPQSAHCLFDYITQCPLVAVTQEIIAEISLVLGRLIDRLHEEEKYPPFLEQLLNKVHALLREISRETECVEHILLDKDETIQRLLLLNKSKHILKFSIEKIVNVLEKTHSYLTSKENLHELTSIEEVENTRYIFYVLEIFLQMYIKNKDSSSQCTQGLQESKILKRSSITEIWKKKWNPHFKESKTVGSQDKGCVLTKCGEVLNKIVVDCMDGYSLVSFAALQCFNLLQN